MPSQARPSVTGRGAAAGRGLRADQPVTCVSAARIHQPLDERRLCIASWIAWPCPRQSDASAPRALPQRRDDLAEAGNYLQLRPCCSIIRAARCGWRSAAVIVICATRSSKRRWDRGVGSVRFSELLRRPAVVAGRGRRKGISRGSARGSGAYPQGSSRAALAARPSPSRAARSPVDPPGVRTRRGTDSMEVK